jgi:hypothetical protein
MGREEKKKRQESFFVSGSIGSHGLADRHLRVTPSSPGAGSLESLFRTSVTTHPPHGPCILFLRGLFLITHQPSASH